ncbi:RDD family protein [Sunxiuqinia sp. sy24]|uniref:RDD family protein n=1 Tax=Sunxiuqinia sp. sy24 TaxID=3461495 RepID=UPI0040458CCC
MGTKNVSRRIRFLSFLVDFILFSLIGIFILILLKSYTPFLSGLNDLNDKIIILVLYFAYYFLFELIIQSTPGKLLTKTKVISQDNAPASARAILIRSLLRIVPFEPISILLYENKLAWHDRLSKTKIININL